MRNMEAILGLEKYIPVMTAEELANFEQVAIGRKMADFNPFLLSKWEALTLQRWAIINEKFSSANDKSNELCKARKIALR